MSSDEQEPKTDRVSSLQEVVDLLAAAERRLSSVGYPNEIKAIRRIWTVVESHRSNAVVKDASQTD